MMAMFRGAALVLLLDAPAVSMFQTPPVFRAEARVVVVDVTVRRNDGELVSELDRDAFTVYENGKRQPITLFLKNDVPVSLGLVIDNSGSMRARRATVEAAALAFARASNPRDEMFVVNFADTPRLDVPFTTDVRVLEAGAARIDAIGGSAVRDAIDLAETYLRDHATRERKALLVITDGRDNASSASADHIRQRAERENVAVYAIGLPEDETGKSGRGGLELSDLAERTGGVALHLASIEEVEPATVRLASDIRRQYTLGYTPLNQKLDGSYRKIHVDVKGAGMSARTRAGYYATNPGSRRGERP